MDQQTYFSVIIPAHNEEKYISKTVLALLSQEYPNFEVIVVPNGCNDQTEQKVQEIISETGFGNVVKSYTDPVANVSKARNIGAQNSSGNVLVFLDADTIVKPDTLVKVAKTLNCKHTALVSKVKPDRKGIKFWLVMSLKNILHITKIYYGSSGLIACPREAFDKVGGFNENIVVKENHDLIKRLVKHGKYSCIDSYVITSMRRYEEWGLIKATYFWLKQWSRYFGGGLEKVKYEKIR